VKCGGDLRRRQSQPPRTSLPRVRQLRDFRDSSVSPVTSAGPAPTPDSRLSTHQHASRSPDPAHWRKVLVQLKPTPSGPLGPTPFFRAPRKPQPRHFGIRVVRQTSLARKVGRTATAGTPPPASAINPSIRSAPTSPLSQSDLPSAKSRRPTRGSHPVSGYLQRIARDQP
jgi:hypothetical protein